MNLNPYLDVAPEVAAAVAAGKPVVAWSPPSSPTACPTRRMWRPLSRSKPSSARTAPCPPPRHSGRSSEAGLSPEEIEYLGKKGPRRQ